MKKTKKLLIASMLVIVMLALALFAGCADTANYAEANLDFDGLSQAPTQEAIAKATPIDTSKLAFSDTETTDQAVLDAIKYLLTLSNQNLIDSDFFAAGSYGAGVAQMTIAGENIVGSMQTRETRIFDNDTYYLDTYGLVIEGYKLNSDGTRGNNVNSTTVRLLAGALDFTKRVYSPNNEDFYFSKHGESDKNSLVNFPDQNSIIYSKPKSTVMTNDEYLKFTYSRYSFKEYTSDDYNTQQPITSGLLTYDAELGVYYLEAEINCDDETLKLSNEDMLSNGAIDKFRYAQKRLKVEIWDCGLVRRYINENRWEATIIKTIKGSSENIYEQWFSYDKSKLDKMNIDQSLKDALM